jgi:uncharacterized protein
MKWRGRRQSTNVEDLRSSSGGFRFPGLGRSSGYRSRGSKPRKLSLTTIIIALLAMYFFKINPLTLLQSPIFEVPTGSEQQIPSTPKTDTMKQFMATVLGHQEETWHQIFKDMGKTYQEPKLVLFSRSVRSACGFAASAMGPFYCPADRKVYIDLSFYNDLKNRHGAPGDFAQAYVLAHEVGHHVQNLLGTSTKVHRLQQRASKAQSNKLSVMLELQADCYAGVWANRANELLESGDLEEALVAASAIGDDRLQKQSRGFVVPDSFTHGSSAQRVEWFKKGRVNGNIGVCNTFDGV